MSIRGIQGELPAERRILGVRPLVSLVILLSVLVISFGDTLEIIPIFAPLLPSPFFQFFHGIHDVLALGVALYAAYKYDSRLGTTAILFYLAAHIPYAIIRFSGEMMDLLHTLFTGFLTLFGIWLINRLQKAERILRLQAELLDTELDSVYLLDFDGNILYANKAACVNHGYTEEELLSIKLSELDDPESAKLIKPRLEDILRNGGAMFELNHRRKNGSLIPLEVHASVAELRGKKVIMNVARDISERQKMQEQLMAQDRLASIGQLVSGVAHEINNPLTSVIGFSDLMLQRDLPDDIKADLTIINDEAKRTAKIVQNLLAFARKQPEGKEPVDINAQIQRVLGLRDHEQSISNIHVDTHFAPDLLQVTGNASQLQQVFFNIIVNAEQAMLEAHNRGTLTITTERVGNIVKARFTDDGPGISPENMKRLFTPFFTTKGIGKGTGLGLSICHGIITGHDGRIYAKSEPGKGATFIVELPVIPKRVTTEESAG